jgi:hypothetical protein
MDMKGHILAALREQFESWEIVFFGWWLEQSKRRELELATT